MSTQIWSNLNWVFRTIRGGCYALMSSLDFDSPAASLVGHVANLRDEVSLVGTPNLHIKQDLFRVYIDMIDIYI